MRNRLAVMMAGVLLTPLAAQAQDKPALAPVPTTKVLAMGSIVGTPTPDEMKQIMPSEVSDTVRLYLGGKIDQWWARQDQRGVLFLMNVTSVEEAHALLEKLPLGERKLMRFDLIPLGPLSPLRYLLPAPAKP